MIDRYNFYGVIKQNFGGLKQSQVNGINFLLDSMEKDISMSDNRFKAYALATVKHETANTYLPIHEIGKGAGHPYAPVYYGRGYVQLTWISNYDKFSKLLKIDLIDDPKDPNDNNDPDKVTSPEVAYKIMSLGMVNGLFTGVGLKNYINKFKCDYKNARKIINGLDCADKIAGYATIFERALTN